MRHLSELAQDTVGDVVREKVHADRRKYHINLSPQLVLKVALCGSSH